MDIRYTDGHLTIRKLCADDIEMHLAAIDDAQIDWLWEPGDRESWEAMDRREQREHQLRFLHQAEESFGPGPVWRFAVDTENAPYVTYVDCNLANPHVPAGLANISYTTHPAHRGMGYASGGVRLIVRFLAESTVAPEAHILVDARNTPSLRVAQAVGASEVERWTNAQGRPMIRHVIDLGPLRHVN